MNLVNNFSNLSEVSVPSISARDLLQALDESTIILQA